MSGEREKAAEMSKPKPDVIFMIRARIDSGSARGASQLNKDVRVLKKAEQEIVCLRKQRDELLAALEGVLPWVVTQTVACHGMKCPEPICLSCTDQAEAEESAQKACDMYSAAKAAIASVKGQK